MTTILLSEVLRDIETAKEFCKENKIKPFAVIVLWEEEVEK